jgi:hypothetical protein
MHRIVRLKRPKHAAPHLEEVVEVAVGEGLLLLLRRDLVLRFPPYVYFFISLFLYSLPFFSIFCMYILAFFLYRAFNLSLSLPLYVCLYPAFNLSLSLYMYIYIIYIWLPISSSLFQEPPVCLTAP